ncbi:hypothetical protein AB0I60_11715 [Actinosynnema sp. NPDC050436]|uniref:hypothetical protein n=1 Tax=Actinosynnema sp. NPDC050436 TaxID=3155659 RepID=UPI0033E60867
MDEQPYPVVAERVLTPLPPKRLFSRTRGRDPEEVPAVRVGHRLVYRAHNQYVLDASDLTLDSPTVVEASHVALVDVTVDAGVVVELVIPSRDASNFTTRVTFLCTVDDPVAVVSTGGHDARAMLAGYLKGHQRIFELGLDFGLEEINDVRRKLNAQIRAYATLNPPEFAGMRATLAGVEVLTPDQVAKLEDALREAKQSHVVKTAQLANEQRLGDLEHIHRRTREVQDGEHTRSLDHAQRHYAREELKRSSEAVAANPIAALHLAYSAGELTTRELADELRRVREQEVQQDREDLRAAIEYEREQQRLRWAAERDDASQQRKADLRREVWAREDRRHQREVETRHAEARRVDGVRRAEWERQDRQLERESAAKEMEAKLEVIRELAKHGHLDTLNLRLDRFVNDMLGDRGTPALDRAETVDRVAIAKPEDEPRPADEDVDPGDAELLDDDRNTRVEA